MHHDVAHRAHPVPGSAAHPGCSRSSPAIPHIPTRSSGRQPLALQRRRQLAHRREPRADAEPWQLEADRRPGRSAPGLRRGRRTEAESPQEVPLTLGREVAVLPAACSGSRSGAPVRRWRPPARRASRAISRSASSGATSATLRVGHRVRADRPPGRVQLADLVPREHRPGQDARAGRRLRSRRAVARAARRAPPPRSGTRARVSAFAAVPRAAAAPSGIGLPTWHRELRRRTRRQHQRAHRRHPERRRVRDARRSRRRPSPGDPSVPQHRQRRGGGCRRSRRRT